MNGSSFAEARSPFGSTSSISISRTFVDAMATITCTRPVRLATTSRPPPNRSPADKLAVKLAKLALNTAQDIRSVSVKKKLLTTCAGTALSLFGCASEHSSSTQRLLSYDSSDADRQAQLLTGFDYSRHLQS